MNAIYKSVWSIVLLGLVVGCGGEPETAGTPPADGGAKASYPPTGKAGAGVKSPPSTSPSSGAPRPPPPPPPLLNPPMPKEQTNSRQSKAQRPSTRTRNLRLKSSPPSRNCPRPTRPWLFYMPSARSALIIWARWTSLSR